MIARRDLLRGAAALASARFLGAATQARIDDTPAQTASDPFAFGVASGDPRRDGMVLWTRLTGIGGDRRVGWEIAEDAGFRRIVRRGEALAPVGRAGAVHVRAAGLRPGRPYHYRFHFGGVASAVGRTVTAPIAAERLRLALVSCQHWEQGWFSAYRDILASDADLLLHVGDYIYEKSFGRGPDVRRFGTPEPRTLDDYRARYALYRSDPDLRAAHAAMPFAVTWDDHEVENDYAGEQGVATADPRAFLERRAAAYQAYYEHMPLDPATLRPGGEVRLYRRIDWGDLATILILDTRQYRTAHPCSTGGKVIEACAAARDPAATMMGTAQERWLAQQTARAPSRWTLLTQQTLFSRLRLPDGPDARYSDIWDGYAATRDRTLAALAPTRNAVVLGGDVHSFWLNDVHRDAENPDSPIVASEVVTSCLASRPGPDALFGPAQRLNPHVRFLDNAHAGHVLLDVAPDRIDVRARAVISLADPASGCTTLTRGTIVDRRPGFIA